MNRTQYDRLEAYMLKEMRDAAHDVDHVYRVLHAALIVAEGHPEADGDALIAACLLHDVGRDAQNRDSAVDHAAEGAWMARAFLLAEGWPDPFADLVADCVRTHRYRGGDPPASIEARILFDADKLDASGAIGVARTLLYGGAVGRPLCARGDLADDRGGREMHGRPRDCAEAQIRHIDDSQAPSAYKAEDDSEGAPQAQDSFKTPATERESQAGKREESVDGSMSTDSFVGEYRFKLKNVYERFYTDEARAFADARRSASASFFTSLMDELGGVAARGGKILSARLTG